MKTRFCALLIFLCIVSGPLLLAQKEHSPKCSFEQDSSELAVYRSLLALTEHRQVQQAHARTRASTGTIPVVVHVIEPNTGSSLITDAQVHRVISNLNASFGATGYYSESIDTGIRFQLAKRSPDCTPTTGITRFDASASQQYGNFGVRGASGISLDALLSWVQWDKNQYLNVWIVNRLDGASSGGLGGPSLGVILAAGGLTGLGCSSAITGLLDVSNILPWM